MLYNVKEVSKCLGINIHLVYALIRKGLLPALKLGSLKVRRASLESFISKYEGMDALGCEFEDIIPLTSSLVEI